MDEGQRKSGKRNHAPAKLAAINLKKLEDGWHADGGNLYLFVRGNSRTWVFRFTGPDGKRKNMGLGPLDSVSLAEARKQAAELRSKVKHPTAPADPLKERQEQRNAARLEKAKSMTFKACAMAYIEAQRAEWKNPKHAQQWENTLSTYVYPTFGSLPVSAIDTGLVMKCLEAIWTTKTETATRLRGRIESVLSWATVRQYRQGDNPARWKGHLDTLLPRPNKIAKVEHHAALPYSEIGEFMADLRKRDGMGARALEFAILTATRSGEVRGATWDEVDLEKGVWTIPADRMKAGKEHRVPLSVSTLELLKALPKVKGASYVFPSTQEGKQLSDMTLTAVLRRMDRGDLTAHGFRSTFRDWAAEMTNFPREVCEHALAHQLPDKVEAAYRRGDLFIKREKLMAAWADYCNKSTAGAEVVPMNRGVAKSNTAA